MDARKAAAEIFRSAVKAVDPYGSVKKNLGDVLSCYREGGFENLYVVAFGKGAHAMCRAVEDSFENLITGGIAVTKYGLGGALKKILMFEASHPLPDINGLKATRKVMQLLNSAGEDSLVLCLISGGGSALFVSPCEGITLDDQRQATDLLLKAGADISELNAVRKHISNVKGGMLAMMAFPASIISLILSDVVGDHLDVIASGPTAPDSSTFQDAMDVINRHSLAGRMPGSVTGFLERGIRGEVKETPKPADPLFDKVKNRVIANNRTALDAAMLEAERMGFKAEIRAGAVTGEASEAGEAMAEFALMIKRKGAGQPPLCFISGGETTVSVRGSGKGGRNMELALAFAQRLDGERGITLLSAGTDGIDGVTDAAGAIVDRETIIKAKKAGLDPAEYLDNNDSCNLLNKTGDLLITGPTGTNVTDIQVLIVE